MKSNKYLSVVSLAVLGLCCTRSAFAQLKATAFPGTFQDVPFSQRVQTKAAGYEPYKDMKAYVIPEFKKTDQKFKDEMCERDREECCRRWPDYKNNVFSCLPQIIYEMYGGSKAKCKGTAPESYYTPKGATITCVPERKRSKFLGWCKDAGLTDCDMMQTIAPGEKDDKFFWASWDCEKSPYTWSYIKTQTSCDCPDENMDNNCKCSGRGMDPDSTAEGKCKCLSDEAIIQDGKCVCTNDPSYDPTTDCTEPEPEPEPEPEVCSDPGHMDENDDCKCMPKGKSHEEGGLCVCDDRSLDIDTGCDSTPPPPDAEYLLLQCRTKGGRVDDFLNSYQNTPISKNALVKSKGNGGSYLQCSPTHDYDIDKCFYPCLATPEFSPSKINEELDSIIPPFCAGNSGRGGHQIYFTSRDDGITTLTYTKDDVDKVFNKISGRADEFRSRCRTYGGKWYWYVFAFRKDSDNNLIFYKYTDIGY